MANSKQFYRSIDLQKNEIQNAVAHNLASAPSSPVEGQFYYNTGDNKLYYYDGSNFESFAGDITSIADNGNGTVNVTSGTEGNVTLEVNIANLINDSSSTSSNLWSASKIISYTQTATEGLNVKLAVAAATTTALAACTYDNGTSGVGATLTGDANGALAAIDGVTLVADERVLIQDQADAAENGIYTVTTVGDASNAFVLTRTSDFDTTDDVKANSFCFVEAGTTYGDKGLVLASGDSPTVGTTDLVFTQFTGAGAFTSGDGLSQSGNTINVNVDNSSIEINSDTLRLKDAGITTAKIADSQVTTAKVADDAITTAKILDSNVTTGKVADSAITTAKIADLNVTTAKLAANAVTNAKVADNAISTANIVDANITTAKILDSNITTAKIADDAVTNAKVADDAVTTAKIVDSNVTTAKVADANITNSKLASDAVSTIKIVDANITTAKIADDAVTADKLGNKYAAAFAGADFSSGDLTIAAATHGVGATEDLVVTVKDSNGDDVTSGVEVSIASSGNVTVSVNTGLEFSGRIIIRN